MQQAYVAEKVLGYKQVSGAAGTFLGPIPKGTSLILLQVSAACRWRDDGPIATPTVGYPLAAGQELRYTATGMEYFNITTVGGANAVFDMVFYG